MNRATIISGASGSGKTTFAEYIKGLNFNNDVRVCTADDFFMRDGEYKFDAALLGAAHNTCQIKFLKALIDNVDVVVANTNTTQKERDWYIQEAKGAGYQVFSIVMENHLGTKDVHGVPPETLQRQRQNLKNSLRL